MAKSIKCSGTGWKYSSPLRLEILEKRAWAGIENTCEA